MLLNIYSVSYSSPFHRKIYLGPQKISFSPLCDFFDIPMDVHIYVASIDFPSCIVISNVKVGELSRLDIQSD